MSAPTRLAIRLCGLVAFFLFSFSAFALVPTQALKKYYFDNYQPSGGGFLTVSEAGNYAASGRSSQWSTFTFEGCSGDTAASPCTLKSGNSVYTIYLRVIFDNQCPSNSSSSGSACSCSSGFKEDSTHTSCVPDVNQCLAGQGSIKTINNTLGYSTSPTDDPSSQNVVGNVSLPPVTVCSGGCEWDSVSSPSIASTGWVSQVPTAQGLYRISADTAYRQSAVECTTSTPSANPQSAAPSCPGYVGQVNGKTVCAMPKGVSTGDKVPAAAVGNNLNPGNPAAGVKPDTGSGSGSGSGRTPTEGTGGADGGPIGSTVKDGAGSSTGTVTKPAEGTEQQACGAPGQPVCAVTLDEKGTPKGLDDQKLGVFDDAKKSFDDAIVGITGTSGKDTSWGVVPSWFTPGACAPVNLWTLPEKLGSRQIVLDLCPVMDEIHLLTNFLWVVATFFLTINMVRETVTKGK